MIKYITTLAIFLTFAFVFVVNPAAAEGRYKIFEMGESGQTVSSLMTLEEIVTKDAEEQRFSEIRRKSSIDDRQTIAYEMAESGMLIEFPARVNEINSVYSWQGRHDTGN